MSVTLEHCADGDFECIKRNADITARNLRQPMPNARVFNSVAIATNAGVILNLAFDSESWDVGDLHVINGSRLTAPITGLYLIGAGVQYASVAGGVRDLFITKNGVTRIAYERRAATGAFDLITMTTLHRLAAGDFVEASVFQNSAGVVNIDSVADLSPVFWMYRVGGFTNEGVA
jgi:hypothetical protein